MQININPKTLTVAKKWVSPTVLEVSLVIAEITKRYKLTDSELPLLIGMSDRTIRRWKNKVDENPSAESTIPYSEWCKLILLATDEMIFGGILDCDVSLIPSHIITNAANFKGVTKADMMKFIGKTSITKLTRINLAKIFKWNSVYLGRVISQDSVTFSTVAMILILCGIPKEKVFYV
ncbi:hypothetical protein GNP80_08955 [Aliivibrio fischeri]|uniref:hypothetical protein n=1 Tax=Aliivibrio fischeri TaxID=668 RepID=UPI0012D99100|nr:hypothetical protein [Aliivibrio fischeri]MUK92570.1 hypothetical protein [Aliivibrio fischeri]